MAHLKIHIRLLIAKWSRSHAYQSQSCGLKNRQIASVWTREKRDCASGRQKKAETLFFLFNIWGQTIYGLSFWVLINLHIQEKYTQKAYSSCPLTLVMLKVHIFWESHKNFAKSFPNFWLQYIQSKVRGRFRKILWPSQNIWTLTLICYKVII